MTPDQLAARGVRVKPLEWSYNNKTGCWSAPYDHERYYVVSDGQWTDGTLNPWVMAADNKAARAAAAEADHAARICAALEMMEDGE